MVDFGVSYVHNLANIKGIFGKGSHVSDWPMKDGRMLEQRPGCTPQFLHVLLGSFKGGADWFEKDGRL